MKPVKIVRSEQPTKTKATAHKLFRRSDSVWHAKTTDALLEKVQKLKVKADAEIAFDTPVHDQVSVTYFVHGNWTQDISRKLSLSEDDLIDWKVKAVPELCTKENGKPCFVCAEAIRRFPNKNYPPQIVIVTQL